MDLSRSVPSKNQISSTQNIHWVSQKYPVTGSILNLGFCLIFILSIIWPVAALAMEPSASNMNMMTPNLEEHNFMDFERAEFDQSPSIQACYACHIQSNTRSPEMNWVESNELPVQFAGASSQTFQVESLNAESQICMNCHAAKIDMRHTHPIGVNYAFASRKGGLKPLNSSIHLSSQGTVECTSCHNPHNNDNGKFLRNSSQTALCYKCHDK